MYSRRGPNGNVGGPPPIMMVPGAVVGLGGSGGGAHLIGEDSEESGIGNEPDEDQVGYNFPFNKSTKTVQYLRDYKKLNLLLNLEVS